MPVLSIPTASTRDERDSHQRNCAWRRYEGQRGELRWCADLAPVALLVVHPAACHWKKSSSERSTRAYASSSDAESKISKLSSCLK